MQVYIIAEIKSNQCTLFTYFIVGKS
jgi:hypothetical protein